VSAHRIDGACLGVLAFSIYLGLSHLIGSIRLALCRKATGAQPSARTHRRVLTVSAPCRSENRSGADWL